MTAPELTSLRERRQNIALVLRLHPCLPDWRRCAYYLELAKTANEIAEQEARV